MDFTKNYIDVIAANAAEAVCAAERKAERPLLDYDEIEFAEADGHPLARIHGPVWGSASAPPLEQLSLDRGGVAPCED